MLPTPAIMARGVAITAIIAGVGACQTSTVSTPSVARHDVTSSLVLTPVNAASAASAPRGASSEIAPWEHGRNDIALGATRLQPIQSDTVLVQRTTERLRTTNGRPRENSVWTTRSQRITVRP